MMVNGFLVLVIQKSRKLVTKGNYLRSTLLDLRKKKKIEWSEKEDEVLRIGLLTYGNDYSKMKDKFFSDRIDIKAHDINNHISNTPHLKQIQDSNLKKHRAKSIQDFHDSVNNERALVLRDDSESDEDDDNCSNNCECQQEITTPIQLKNGYFLVPNETFLRDSPFYYEAPESYKFCMRQHLGQFLDVQLLKEEKILEWRFTALTVLTQDEMSKVGQEMILTEKDNSLSIQHTKLPMDVDLSARPIYTERNTDIGKILQVEIKKLKEVDLTYCSPRTENIITSVKPNVKLANASTVMEKNLS
jgi:hypothetical protein